MLLIALALVVMGIGLGLLMTGVVQCCDAHRQSRFIPRLFTDQQLRRYQKQQAKITFQIAIKCVAGDVLIWCGAQLLLGLIHAPTPH